MLFNRTNNATQKEMFSQIQNRNYTFSCGNSSNRSTSANNTNVFFNNLNNHLNENVSFLNKIEKDSKVQQMSKQHQNRMIRRQKQGMMMKKGCGCGGK